MAGATTRIVSFDTLRRESYLAADGARRTCIIVECWFENISLKAVRYAAEDPETVRRIGEHRRPAVGELKD